VASAPSCDAPTRGERGGGLKDGGGQSLTPKGPRASLCGPTTVFHCCCDGNQSHTHTHTHTQPPRQVQPICRMEIGLGSSTRGLLTHSPDRGPHQGFFVRGGGALYRKTLSVFHTHTHTPCSLTEPLSLPASFLQRPVLPSHSPGRRVAPSLPETGTRPSDGVIPRALPFLFYRGKVDFQLFWGSFCRFLHIVRMQNVVVASPRSEEPRRGRFKNHKDSPAVSVAVVLVLCLP